MSLKEKFSAEVQLDCDLNCCKTELFDRAYPMINKELFNNGPIQHSRNGSTREFLNFKTIIKIPQASCVGGFKRDINVFFLLAEALWIWNGCKDVNFLSVFNSNMTQFSDDGKVFHAPYGYRMRNYGASSINLLSPNDVMIFSEDYGKNRRIVCNEGENYGYFDQIYKAIKLLSSDKDDRRVVISIWNPYLDLDMSTKDIPCNDMLMFKVRNGRLFTTIQNRSNDLHWGLPTNVFQFSFISRLMSWCLGIEQGDQVHNSQSLHLYLDNPIASKMFTEMEVNKEHTYLYDNWDFYCNSPNFNSTISVERLEELDHIIEEMLSVLRRNISRDLFGEESFERIKEQVFEFSPYLSFVLDLLNIYVDYTKTQRTDLDKINSIERIVYLLDDRKYGCKMNTKIDLIGLALNFFVSRIKGDKTMIMALLSDLGDENIGNY
jgi:thymidylate synthase